MPDLLSCATAAARQALGIGDAPDCIVRCRVVSAEAVAKAVTLKVLAAQAEWARTASPADVGDQAFFEEGLRGFAREHGLS